MDSKYTNILLRRIQFARELPRPIRLLCIAEPKESVAFANDNTTALFDAVCGEGARHLDLARGGFVCDDHKTRGGWTLSVHDLHHLIARYDSSTGGARQQGTPSQLAHVTLRLIHRRLIKLWHRNYPEATLDEFGAFNDLAWEHVGKMLTFQTRISCHRALMHSDN
jgi:hypothetical protein